jgi:hypothetical protein
MIRFTTDAVLACRGPVPRHAGGVVLPEIGGVTIGALQIPVLEIAVPVQRIAGPEGVVGIE